MRSTPTDHPPLLAIVGPTAVGKTALALQLAQALDGEVVSADSRQVYRGMDIGTAKPSALEQREVRHHLIDVVEPDEDFSLGVYQDLACEAIRDIRARGRLPMLVGGTGQYLAALLQGWNIPRVEPQPELRSALEQEAAEHGNEALHARLALVDPQAAATIPASNVRRVIRALEVHHVTGQPISAQQSMSPPPYNIRTLWLVRPAAELYRRIDERVDQMMRSGLLEEVRGLAERGYSWDLPAMTGLGYREFRPFLAGELSLDEAVERLKFDTHAFARRQAAWFKRLPGLTRLLADSPDLTEQAVQVLREPCLVRGASV